MQRIKTLPLLFVLTLFTLAALSSCDVSNSSSSTGTLKIRLTDAPASYEAVYIDIQRVELNTSTDEDGENDWETISTQPVRIDLLKLDNGADSLLASAELETKTYSRIRLVLGSNNEVIVDGQSHTLTVAGGQEAGFKLDIDATVREDMETIRVIDFDAARSVSVTGNGEYKLNPTLKVFDPAETGSLSGQLVPPGVPVLISARIGNETIATTYAEDDGSFKLVGLEDNVYKLLVEPATGQYADTTLFEQPVTTGQDHTVGIIQLREIGN